ncbi:hypothetical protein H7F51_02455 [Novosphingobium flavum]|uniref:Autotransporter domain-containing protein n=1 Tax=Novosphingobium flavum TaxID=1778672 RepID=A0A7X1FP99_9SPHN|nr:autotransporter outer membrane beta-barrel domain-containing protein [Novosphingobium flavum]MBC2664374.1 hypothetical protein [Novosphingobium flavum]
MTSYSVTSTKSDRARKQRLALAVTTALVGFNASHAFAEDVDITANSTVTTVNTAIDTAVNLPAADIAITITTPAVVTGGANLVLAPTGTAGEGDGAITFTNTGNLGVVTTGTVTDAVGVTLSGVGVASAANTVTVSNSGLITSGISATGFGGANAITNSGTVYGPINATGYDNVTVSTTAAGKVLVASGNAVSASAYSTSDADVSGGFTTTTWTGGNAVINQDGAATLLNGTTGADLSAYAETGDATVNVGAKAGTVYAYAGDTVASAVSGSTAAVDGETTRVYENSYTWGNDAAAVTVAAAGDVTGVVANGAGSATVTVAGKVGAGGVSASSNRTDYSDTDTETVDADGNTTEYDNLETYKLGGGTATVTVAAGGTVGTGGVSANGDAGASITANGNVTGSLAATSQGTETTYVSNNSYQADGSILAEHDSSIYTLAGGAANVTVGTGVTIGGSVSATGTTSAAVANSGKVTGSITASSTGYDETYTDDYSYDADGVETLYVDGYGSNRAGGAAAVTVAAGGSVGGSVTAVGDTSATVTANGNVTGSITADQMNGYDYSQAYSYPAAGGETDTYTYTYAPGTASVAVGANVKVGGNVSAYSNGAATVTAAAGSIINGSVTVDAQPGSNEVDTYTYGASAPVTGDYTTTYHYVEQTAGSTASLTNGGYIKGDVDVYGVTGATVTNTGQIAGQTSVYTYGQSSDELQTYKQVTATAGDVTTVTDSYSDVGSYAGTGGSITGTYSGTNGQVSFSPNQDGSIYQEAAANSTLTLSGTVYGSLTSYAGYDNSTGTYSNTETTVTATDAVTPANNTQTYTETSNSTETDGAGVSTITVSGLVSDAYDGAEVYSEGTSGSTVNVSGTVYGNVYSYADGISTDTEASTYTTLRTGAGLALTSSSDIDAETTTVTSGAAVGNLTGSGVVYGDLDVDGVSSATASVGANAKLYGDLDVYAGGTDYTYNSSDISAYNLTAGTSTRVDKYSYTYTPAAASGNASATVDGYVDDSVYVSAARGNASATVTGRVAGYVEADAGSSVYTYGEERQYSGTASPTTLNKYIETSSSTATGGTATVTVNTSAAQKALGVGSTIPSVSDVYAYGLGGATVTIAAGSSVADSVYAQSSDDNTAYTYTRTYAGGTSTVAETGSSTAVGAAASVVNNGTVGGEVWAEGRTAASVTNAGKAGSLGAYSLDTNETYTYSDNDVSNLTPSTHKIITTTVYTPVGGAATVTNSGTTNGVSLAGATGTLTNSGTITGDVYLGDSVVNGTYVQTVTSTTTSNPTPVFTPSATLFGQAYTVAQNGALTGNIYVDGADYTDYLGNKVKTSNVAATINLNTGSTTKGSIFGANNTTTVVNVAGGNLTLVGPAYVPASATVLTPTYSAGLAGGSTGGSFALNVNSGTASITPVTTGSKIFGLNGSVTVGASGTLVVGLLTTPTVTAGTGASVNTLSPYVTGANLLVTGNFASTGTVAVGLNGALVKNPTLLSSTSTDFIAPITSVLTSAGTGFTTGGSNTASSVTVGGNLNLGGTVKVYVPTGSIFLGTESQTLFTATGTIANTATVSSNLSSQFVKLALVTSGQTVQLKATRSNYSVGATNPNAASAASALTAAIPGVVSMLANDVAGIRTYTSLSQLSNAADIANIVTNLDWTLNATQAATVFNELASGSIYGSLANLRQNAVLNGQFDQLAQRRETEAGAVSLWMSPVGSFAKYSGTDSGASKIDATTYGAAIGVDVGYGDGGAFGFGFGYGRHNFDAMSFPASVDADTYTLGAYLTQSFGPLAVNAKFAYGFSTFDAHRDLTVLARKITGHFRGSEWDGSIGLSYLLQTGGMNVEPFADLSLRHWHTNGFTEEGGAGVGLNVQGAGKTVFDPTVGVRLSGNADPAAAFSLKPYASLSYTFQGDAGTARTVSYVGDPASTQFVLNGVNPKGYGSIGAGVTATVSNKVSLSLGGTYDFGSNNSVAAIRGAIGIKF